MSASEPVALTLSSAARLVGRALRAALPAPSAHRSVAQEQGMRRANARRTDVPRLVFALWALLLLAVLALWPLDQIVFRHSAEWLAFYRHFRPTATVVSVGWLALLRGSSWARARAIPISALLLYALATLSGRWLGAQLPLSSGWMTMPYIVLFVPATVPAPLARRLAMTVLGLALFSAGYFSARPEELSSPFFGAHALFSGFVACLSTALGHIAWSAIASSELQTDALVALNDELEHRVRERTESLRALLRSMDRVRDAERAQIARDLHDELGQELTALHYALWLQREKLGREPALLDRCFDELRAMLERTRQSARYLLTDLRPMALIELGLERALRWLVERARERSGIDIEFVCSAGDERALSPELLSALFRIAQESLTNIERHSQARRATLSIERTGDEVVLRVEDDGVGLRSDEPSGFGLIGIRERAHTLGARCVIENRAEGGVRVLVHASVERAAQVTSGHPGSIDGGHAPRRP